MQCQGEFRVIPATAVFVNATVESFSTWSTQKARSVHTWPVPAAGGYRRLGGDLCL